VKEFVNGLKDYLTSNEATTLFKAIDHDGNNVLTTDEISVELATINCALIMDMITRNKNTSGMSVKDLFNTYDMDSNNKMDVIEFSQMIN